MCQLEAQRAAAALTTRWVGSVKCNVVSCEVYMDRRRRRWPKQLCLVTQQADPLELAKDAKNVAACRARAAHMTEAQLRVAAHEPNWTLTFARDPFVVVAAFEHKEEAERHCVRRTIMSTVETLEKTRLTQAQRDHIWAQAQAAALSQHHGSVAKILGTAGTAGTAGTKVKGRMAVQPAIPFAAATEFRIKLTAQALQTQFCEPLHVVAAESEDIASTHWLARNLMEQCACRRCIPLGKRTRRSRTHER